ncbi:hypothetical protein N0B31_22115 (plasmid) [Salinirubellus salinus]|uniref:Uncharacterized protein n=1 Tax=Salinirubellus salinus TaxID=1364945 RepID=A0A9E7UDD3_9EURY|nr:hypothetical protein [Salinirubellus salinus]UWM56944.1 hypothetical protein N0B31_22115 [Salinirubellus salinus]
MYAAGGFAVTDIALESLPLFSLAAGSVLGGVLGIIAGYGGFAAAFFIIANRIYCDVLPGDIRGPRFDFLFTAVIVSIMMTQRFVTTQTQLSVVFGILPIFVGGAVLLAVYVRAVGPRSLTDPTSPLVAPYEQVIVWTEVRDNDQPQTTAKKV